MQQAIAAIAGIHRRLADSLAAGDVEQIDELVRQRHPLLEALADAWQTASTAEREKHQTNLQSLRQEEHTLLEQCRKKRDDLCAELSTLQRPPAPGHSNQSSSLFDYQA